MKNTLFVSNSLTADFFALAFICKSVKSQGVYELPAISLGWRSGSMHDLIFDKEEDRDFQYLKMINFWNELKESGISGV